MMTSHASRRSCPVFLAALIHTASSSMPRDTFARLQKIKIKINAFGSLPCDTFARARAHTHTHITNRKPGLASANIFRKNETVKESTLTRFSSANYYSLTRSGICEHLRQKRNCKDCGGSSICKHGTQRNRCKANKIELK